MSAVQMGLPLDPDPPKPTNFKGASYIAHLDGDRLQTQLARIVRFMIRHPGRFFTVSEIRYAMEFDYPDARWPENSIQAQLRNAKSLLGCGHQRRRRGDPKAGLYEFSLTAPEGL